MKVQSTRKVMLVNDREGLLEEFIQIKITQEKKDDETKSYIFRTEDSIVYNKGTENESTTPLNNRYGQPQAKLYYKTYDEYDAEKQALLEAYPSELEGSELDDYLLLCALKYNLEINPIYGLTGAEWE